MAHRIRITISFHVGAQRPFSARPAALVISSQLFKGLPNFRMNSFQEIFKSSKIGLTRGYSTSLAQGFPWFLRSKLESVKWDRPMSSCPLSDRTSQDFP
jgi:hypothetical protein